MERKNIEAPNYYIMIFFQRPKGAVTQDSGL